VPVYKLISEPVFPPASEAEPDGLLAIGGDFTPQRLLNAYASGIFPWFEDEDEIYWFSPDPRLVLFPEKLRIPTSLARIIHQNKFEIRFDHDFSAVMEHCAKVPRQHEEGTWISDRFIKGYTRLHKLGYAHSAEAYNQGKLAGGLYGVAIGRAFFGESMFYLEPDASKVAFVTLVKQLREKGFNIIDCQVETAHLRRFGAEMISRARYLELLAGLI
jgi:leucyl/phenylalanyl-tRNA---protein transferase